MASTLVSSEKDLEGGVNFVTLQKWSRSLLDQHVNSAYPQDSQDPIRGMTLYTSDFGVDHPRVPDAATVTKLQRYIWIRHHWSATSPDVYYLRMYVWDPEMASDPDFLQWKEFWNTEYPYGIYPNTLQGSALADGTVALDKLDPNAFSGNVQNIDGVLWSGITYESVADLRALAGNDLPDTLIVGVLGHTTARDGGGGFFLFQATGSEDDDNGSIITPQDFVGRFYRITSGSPRCEWFGGVPDCNADGTSGTDNSTPIQSCLEAYGSCELQVGAYGVKPRTNNNSYVFVTAVFRENCPALKLTGLGKDASIVRCLADSTISPSLDVNNTAMFFFKGCSGAIIRDFQLDNVFGNWKTDTDIAVTSAGVRLYACPDVLIDGVSARRFNSCKEVSIAKECFILIVDREELTIVPSDPYKDNLNSVKVLNCEFYEAGNDTEGSLRNDHQPEISCITVNGYNDVLILGNHIRNLVWTDTNRSWMQGITAVGCTDVRIVNNAASNFDGNFIYADNKGLDRVVITGNTCKNVRSFLTWSNAAANITPPTGGRYGSFRNALISSNTAELKLSQKYLDYAEDTVEDMNAIRLYTVANRPGQSDFPTIFFNIQITNNQFKGAIQAGSAGNFQATGFTIYIDSYIANTVMVRGIKLNANIFDLPKRNDIVLEDDAIEGYADYGCIQWSNANTVMSNPQEFDVLSNYKADGTPVRAYAFLPGGIVAALREGTYAPLEKHIYLNRAGYLDSANGRPISSWSDVTWHTAEGVYQCVFGDQSTSDPTKFGDEDRSYYWTVYHGIDGSLHLVLPRIPPATWASDQYSANGLYAIPQRVFTFILTQIKPNNTRAGDIHFYGHFTTTVTDDLTYLFTVKAPASEADTIIPSPPDNSRLTRKVELVCNQTTQLWTFYISFPEAPYLNTTPGGTDTRIWGRLGGEWVVASGSYTPP